jgi:hydroxymethylglutaryl-CoA lyase
MNTVPAIKLVECPRDAMQGWQHFIPTEKKIAYINHLLQAGFDTIDFGSFVSPKAIPQMADTKEVLKGLKCDNSNTKLLAIIANVRGAEEAVAYDEISYLGFPFSISETFQQRNTNSSIQESLNRVDAIRTLCFKHNKQLVIYLSMAFGNPYKDAYDESILMHWANEMVQREVPVISLADTVGVASAEQVLNAVKTLVPQYPATEIGVHLHSTAINWREKLEAAVKAGCTRFDGAINGIGGCPMADDELVGNMNTGWMIDYFEAAGIATGVHPANFANCTQMANDIFV